MIKNVIVEQAKRMNLNIQEDDSDNNIPQNIIRLLSSDNKDSIKLGLQYYKQYKSEYPQLSTMFRENIIDTIYSDGDVRISVGKALAANYLTKSNIFHPSTPKTTFLITTSSSKYILDFSGDMGNLMKADENFKTDEISIDYLSEIISFAAFQSCLKYAELRNIQDIESEVDSDWDSKIGIIINFWQNYSDGYSRDEVVEFLRGDNPDMFSDYGGAADFGFDEWNFYIDNKNIHTILDYAKNNDNITLPDDGISDFEDFANLFYDWESSETKDTLDMCLSSAIYSTVENDFVKRIENEIYDFFDSVKKSEDNQYNFLIKYYFPESDLYVENFGLSRDIDLDQSPSKKIFDEAFENYF